jgi:hypothetical protein
MGIDIQAAPQENQHDRSTRQLTVECDALAVKIQQGEGWSFFAELRLLSGAACGNDRRHGQRRSKDHRGQNAFERDLSQTRDILRLS